MKFKTYSQQSRTEIRRQKKSAGRKITRQMRGEFNKITNTTEEINYAYKN